MNEMVIVNALFLWFGYASIIGIGILAVMCGIMTAHKILKYRREN